MPTREHDLRLAVVELLLAQGISEQDIRHELPLDSNSSGGRVDIAVFHGQQIVALELKSGSDTLSRLPHQVARYNAAFDAVHVIFDASHHGHDVRRANCSAHWWSSEHHSLVRWYRGEMQPISSPLLPDDATRWWLSRSTSVLPMACLLWRVEALRVSSELGGPSRGTRDAALAWMRERARLCDVRPLVIRELRARTMNKWELSFRRRLAANS